MQFQQEQMSQIADNERAKRLMAMGQMAASLAHEIRNPLGSMELFCSLLKKDLAAQPEPLQLAEQIHQSIRKLDRVISNCLQFSRDIRPKRKLLKDIKGFLTECAGDVSRDAEKHEVTIDVRCLGEGEVNCDRYQLHQALINLLSNAIDAVSVVDDGRERVVELSSDLRNPHEWVIQVRDNGIGIPQDRQIAIFDPFVTSKQGGTGLGLAIVHSIVHAHGGSIAIESDVGQGTEVRVLLPRNVSA